MPVVMWLAIGLLLASMTNFVNVNRVWLKSFGRDLWRWLLAPQISGPPVFPTDLPVGLAIYLLAGLAALPAARLALSGTGLANDLVARLGTAVVLAFAVLGYAGTIALTLGRLNAVFLWSVITVTAIVANAAWLFVGRGSKAFRQTAVVSVRPNSSRSVGKPLLLVQWLGWPVSVAVVLFSAAHSLMAPITEIDATIYHAAAARLWFLSRPDPPLLFGPSVGIEISGNYPPLFPAIGATIYTALSHFDDFYIRIVPPLIAIGLLLITFSYARWHSGRTVAWWVIVLMLGSPLLVMYMAWTTNYILLAALSLLVLLYCELGATSGRLTAWGAAGVFAGLAVLTNFYGWVTFGFGFIAFLIWMRSGLGVRSVALFGLTGGFVAAPWLIRNWVRLGDPIYPLADRIFHGAGLVQPLWAASQKEIERSALNVFGVAQGFQLITVESAVALESNYLIPAGLAMGLLVGLWRAWTRDPRALYLSGSALLIVVEVLTPGWYWVRALLPLVPIGAVLTGLTIESAFAWIGQHRHAGTVQGFGAGLWTSALVAIAVLSTVTSLSLSIAGPNQRTWTTNLGESADFMQSVRNLGSSDRQLSTAFGDDYESWKWLNARLGPHDRVATFEIRFYYFNRPQNLFYLDGLEAVPLLRLNSADAVRSYLVAHNVRFILIPGWAHSHPAVDLLPLSTMLGSPQEFPLLESFGGTYLYSVPQDGPGS